MTLSFTFGFSGDDIEDNPSLGLENRLSNMPQGRDNDIYGVSAECGESVVPVEAKTIKHNLNDMVGRNRVYVEMRI